MEIKRSRPTKGAVHLTAAGRPSRIRRDPPARVPVKETVYVDPSERERRDAVMGILVFGFAIFFIVLALSSYQGWTPAKTTIVIADEPEVPVGEPVAE